MQSDCRSRAELEQRLPAPGTVERGAPGQVGSPRVAATAFRPSLTAIPSFHGTGAGNPRAAARASGNCDCMHAVSISDDLIQ